MEPAAPEASQDLSLSGASGMAPGWVMRQTSKPRARADASAAVALSGVWAAVKSSTAVAVPDERSRLVVIAPVVWPAYVLAPWGGKCERRGERQLRYREISDVEAGHPVPDD